MWNLDGDDYVRMNKSGVSMYQLSDLTWVLTHGHVDACLRWVNYSCMKKVKSMACSSSQL